VLDTVGIGKRRRAAEEGPSKAHKPAPPSIEQVEAADIEAPAQAGGARGAELNDEDILKLVDEAPEVAARVRAACAERDARTQVPDLNENQLRQLAVRLQKAR
jgi:hypothetical protein